MEEPFYWNALRNSRIWLFTKWFLFRFTSLVGEEFRNIFFDINYAQSIVWNNKYIRIDNRSVIFKLYYENRIVYIRDLIFESDNKQSHAFYCRFYFFKVNRCSWLKAREKTRTNEFGFGIPSDWMNLKPIVWCSNAKPITFRHWNKNRAMNN